MRLILLPVLELQVPAVLAYRWDPSPSGLPPPSQGGFTPVPGPDGAPVHLVLEGIRVDGEPFLKSVQERLDGMLRPPIHKDILRAVRHLSP